MSIQDQLRNPAVGGPIIGACLLLAAYVAYKAINDNDETPLRTKVYFYDLSTGKLFAEDGNKNPPIDAPSGAKIDGEPAGVKAMVFGCGDCSKLQVGYLFKVNAKFAEATASNDTAARAANMFVREEKGTTWHASDTPEGQAVTGHANRTCGQQKIVSCSPPQ